MPLPLGNLIVHASLGKCSVPRDKIWFIHHGAPDVDFIDPNFHKDWFDAEGRIMLLTSGS